MRIFRQLAASLFALAAFAGATTLQKLDLSTMAQQSTGIVRARVTGSRTAFRGTTIYTYYSLQVTENWTPGTAMPAEVAVPGGVASNASGNWRQLAPGAPQVNIGGEYVIFFWTSPKGLTQIMGLSQGLFSVMQDTAGNTVAIRPAAAAMMLDAQGNVIADAPLSVILSALKSQVAQALAPVAK